jgi:hypothetical protein
MGTVTNSDSTRLWDGRLNLLVGAIADSLAPIQLKIRTRIGHLD